MSRKENAMKKIQFSSDSKKAAEQFAKMCDSSSSSRPKFYLIPKTIGSNAEFWLELVEINSTFIANVPKAIKETEEFSQHINHRKFYRYIPTKFLTMDDYQEHKKDPKSEISISGYHEIAEINEHESYSWVTLGISGDDWYAEDTLTPEKIKASIGELAPARDILPELWSQKLADLIWNSSLAMVSFDAIPKQYVREEWENLIEIYKNKRYPLFEDSHTSIHPEKLAEYWGQFKTVDQIKEAIKLEEKIVECRNPYGYTTIIGFGQRKKMEIENPTEFYEKMWEVVKPYIENSTELMDSFFKMYGCNFSKVIPDEDFCDKWILEDLISNSCAELYDIGKSESETANSEVEKIEAKECKVEALTNLKKRIECFRDVTEEETVHFVKEIFMRYRDVTEEEMTDITDIMKKLISEQE